MIGDIKNIKTFNLISEDGCLIKKPLLNQIVLDVYTPCNIISISKNSIHI